MTVPNTTPNTTPAMDKPILVNDPANVTFLQSLQGNILNSHGRDHATHIMVRFKPNSRTEARRWIAEFAARYVTSAHAQYEAAKKFKENSLDGGLFGHIALTAAGYAALGIAEDAQPHGLNPRKHAEGDGYNEVFRKGMKSRKTALADSSPDNWDATYQGDIHMLVLIASRDIDELELAEVDVFETLDAVAELAIPERGMGLTKLLDPTNPKTVAHVEHFGYVDGRSLPFMTEEDIAAEKAKEGIDDYDPTAPLNLVLAPDPLGEPGKSFGSFMVFRKLEQNIRGFNESIGKLAQALSISEDLARAMVMGRFQDGTPVVVRGTSGTTDMPNNWDYDDDPKGRKCPFHAHTRKSNPRRTGKIDDHKHRIARRAIPYGGALTTATKLEDMQRTGKGLLFICYQADIFEQFEFIQRAWSNFKQFPEPNSGIDPVTGQTSGDLNKDAPKLWPAGWDKPLTCPKVDIAGYVKLKGGEYFFSPSMSFLKNLANS